MFICGGASVPPSLIRSAADYFDNAVVTRVYGSTEVPVTTVGAPGDLDHAADTDGRPASRIADVSAARPTARSGPADRRCCVGYLHPEDEADAFDADGYFRTGDLGRWVDDDYLVVTGRAKDIIIRNGENIAPKEVEDVLLGHPDIAEIAIVGFPIRAPASGHARWWSPTVHPGPASPICGTSCRPPVSRNSSGPKRSSSGTRCPRTMRARYSNIRSEQGWSRRME